MVSRIALARKAAASALQTRSGKDYEPWSPVCIYDLAEKLGVAVRFLDVPSIDGVYCKSPPSIILSSLRPPGRQAFTCAHEIGHHVFGDGEHIDEVIEDRELFADQSDTEFLANCFAGHILMPKSAIQRGFSSRDYDFKNCTAEQLYIVATWLGVGYATLISHMTTLKLLSQSRVAELSRQRPANIRSQVVQRKCSSNVIVADRQWVGRPIDVAVSDYILVPPSTEIEGTCISMRIPTTKYSVAEVVSPGIGRAVATDGTWAAFIRCCRKGYSGRAIYRFDEEV